MTHSLKKTDGTSDIIVTKNAVENLLNGQTEDISKFGLDPLATFTKLLIDKQHFNPLNTELRALQKQLDKVERRERQQECDKLYEEFLKAEDNLDFEDDVNFIIDLIVKGNREDIRKELERQDELLANK